jgi:hypothetical protein
MLSAPTGVLANTLPNTWTGLQNLWQSKQEHKGTCNHEKYGVALQSCIEASGVYPEDNNAAISGNASSFAQLISALLGRLCSKNNQKKGPKRR